MLIIKGLSHITSKINNTVIALGFFDGVHLGHRAIILKTKERARINDGRSLVLTFDKHPLSVVSPLKTPPLINSLHEKIEIINSLNVDILVIENFTKRFSNLSAEYFVKNRLYENFKPREIIVGFDYYFGKNREGNADLLKELGNKYGIPVMVVPPVGKGGIAISSTVIREELKKGNIEDANEYLGRSFFIESKVIYGRKRGRLLGFPTANLKPRKDFPLGKGVYAGSVLIDGIKYNSVINIGDRPTFNDVEFAIEAHILDFNRNVYGSTIRIEFVKKIRNEIQFRNEEELKTAIKNDIEMGKALLEGR